MGAPQLIDQNVSTGTPVGTLGGTPNTIPRWTGPTTLGDSAITDNGTVVAFGRNINATSTAGGASYVLTPSAGGQVFGQTVASSVWYLGRTTGAGAAVQADVCINNSGNVGIGTASPLTSAGTGLTVYGTGSGSLYLQNNTDHARIFQQIGNLYIDSSVGSASGTIVFRRGSTVAESARIDSAGRWLLGTSTAASITSVRSIIASASDTYLQFADTALSRGGLVGTLSGGIGLFTYTGAIGSETYALRALAGTSSLDISQTAGYGLKLPATPGNADTQTLDCYQEGTLNTGFTLTGVTTSAGNVNYEARWVRIGRAVSLRLRIFPDAGAQITFAAGANVVMTGTPAATSVTAMAVAANDGPSGRASALWDTNTVYLNTTATFGANVQIFFSGTAV